MDQLEVALILNFDVHCLVFFIYLTIVCCAYTLCWTPQISWPWHPHCPLTHMRKDCLHLVLKDILNPVLQEPYSHASQELFGLAVKDRVSRALYDRINLVVKYPPNEVYRHLSTALILHPLQRTGMMCSLKCCWTHGRRPTLSTTRPLYHQCIGKTFSPSLWLVFLGQVNWSWKASRDKVGKMKLVYRNQKMLASQSNAPPPN